MPLKLNAFSGGSVTLNPASTASDFTHTLPAVSGTVVTTGSSAVVTPAMLSTGAPAWNASGDLSFNSGFGSVGVAYGCRAWVNFNGQGVVAIRASGNVSSITDGGVGRYVINIASAMPDANYVFSLSAQNRDGNDDRNIVPMAERKGPGVTRTASTLHIDAATWLIGGYTGTPTIDPDIINVAIFR